MQEISYANIGTDPICLGNGSTIASGTQSGQGDPSILLRLSGNCRRFLVEREKQTSGAEETAGPSTRTADTWRPAPAGRVTCVNKGIARAPTLVASRSTSRYSRTELFFRLSSVLDICKNESPGIRNFGDSLPG